MKIELNRLTFESLALEGKSLLQIRGGRAQMAETNSPDEDDWIVLPDGMYLVLEAECYLRAIDTEPTIAVAVFI